MSLTWSKESMKNEWMVKRKTEMTRFLGQIKVSRNTKKIERELLKYA